MDDLSRRLLARYQKGLPICAEPYRRMAETLGCSEAEVLERLRRLEADGALGLQPLDLPMQEAYCIDLAFPLEASR